MFGLQNDTKKGAGGERIDLFYVSCSLPDGGVRLQQVVNREVMESRIQNSPLSKKQTKRLQDTVLFCLVWFLDGKNYALFCVLGLEMSTSEKDNQKAVKFF